MKLQLAATALLAAVTLTAANGAYAGAASDDAGAPIHLSAVKIDVAPGVDENFFYPGLITVSFSNVQDKTIDEVDFGLRDATGHLVYQYRDVGPFAPNTVARNHTFTDSQIGAGQTLSVDTVVFHDGTTWYPGARQYRRQEAAISLLDRASK